jgi:hypothetical protein
LFLAKRDLNVTKWDAFGRAHYPEKPLIDKKKTDVGLLATQEILQELPLPRDVWAMEKMTPGAHSRYWNIGGSESLEQDAGTARGDPDNYLNTYAIDVINFPVLSDLGSTDNYLIFDAIDELMIVVGGAADVSQQTSGLTTNAIMKRGGNKHSFGARFYLSDNELQANNLTDKLREAGIDAMTRINETRTWLLLRFPSLGTKHGSSWLMITRKSEVFYLRSRTDFSGTT